MFCLNDNIAEIIKVGCCDIVRKLSYNADFQHKRYMCNTQEKLLMSYCISINTGTNAEEKRKAYIDDVVEEEAASKWLLICMLHES